MLEIYMFRWCSLTEICKYLKFSKNQMTSKNYND